MGTAVQVLGPAADGKGMVLNERVLQEMLCAEAVKDKPVVVLTIVGPRNTGKTTLLKAVLHAVSDTSFALDAPVRFLCEADRPGSVGVAIWSELLPITLPTGQRAALLLMDTWGPFDDSCPPEQRAAVLMLSALISSLLVVHVSARGTCPLGDLMLLKDLGVAAQGVRNCAPLQEVLFLMRQWSGAAPAGKQTDFEPLCDWAQGGMDAKQALIAMQEASDWYGSVSLFLDPDVSRSQTAGSADPSDPATLLASQRAVKRFDEEAVPAAELASYFRHLASVLAQGPCDAAALVRALVEANQGLAMRKAELVYEDKMKMMEEHWHTAVVTEQDLRAAHDRAAHDAQLAFMVARKMDRENMQSDGMKSKLLASLDKQYKVRRERLLSEMEKLEENAKAINAKLGRTCKEKYEEMMELAFSESPLMTLGDLVKSHSRCQLEALSTFDNKKVAPDRSCEQQRLYLYDGLEQLFRTYANKLDQRREKEEEAKGMESRISSISKKAERHYRTIMEEVKPTRLSRVHEHVQRGALLLFESEAKDIPEEYKEQARENLIRDTENQRELLSAQTSSASPSCPASASYGRHQQASAQPSGAYVSGQGHGNLQHAHADYSHNRPRDVGSGATASSNQNPCGDFHSNDPGVRTSSLDSWGNSSTVVSDNSETQRGNKIWSLFSKK